MKTWRIDKDIWKTLSFRKKLSAICGCVLANIGLLK